MRTTTSMKKRRKRKTKSGNKVRACCLFVAVLTAGLCAAKDKSKAKTAQQPYATVAGTVYRDPGFALEGAEVTVTPEVEDRDGVKFKKQQTATNGRGEFAVRVPPVPMKYQVDVKLGRYEPQGQPVQIEGEQRKELSFVLESRK